MTPRLPDELALELVTHTRAGRAQELHDLIRPLSAGELRAVMAELLGATACVLLEADFVSDGLGDVLLQRAAASYLAAGLVEGPA